MSEEHQNQEQNQAGAAAGQQPAQQLDPAFFTCVNEYLELTNKQSKEQGLKRISMASMYAASRFNAHVYLANTNKPAAERKEFLDYMTRMYRRMLNENLDGLGAERGLDVGESELADEYAAMGVKVDAGVSGLAAPATEAPKE
jgi:phage terminase Nu1 subunit (DNA packaging protein)